MNNKSLSNKMLKCQYQIPYMHFQLNCFSCTFVSKSTLSKTFVSKCRLRRNNSCLITFLSMCTVAEKNVAFKQIVKLWTNLGKTYLCRRGLCLTGLAVGATE